MCLEGDCGVYGRLKGFRGVYCGLQRIICGLEGVRVCLEGFEEFRGSDGFRGDQSGLEVV